jgi:hypothetical protein
VDAACRALGPAPHPCLSQVWTDKDQAVLLFDRADEAVRCAEVLLRSPMPLQGEDQPEPGTGSWHFQVGIVGYCRDRKQEAERPASLWMETESVKHALRLAAAAHPGEMLIATELWEQLAEDTQRHYVSPGASAQDLSLPCSVRCWQVVKPVPGGTAVANPGAPGWPTFASPIEETAVATSEMLANEEIRQKVNAWEWQQLTTSGLRGRVQYLIRAEKPVTDEEYETVHRLVRRTPKRLGRILTGITEAEHVLQIAKLPFVRRIEVSRLLFEEG